MGEANALYYAARDPLGAAGDFVTAPEISQMFGELLGLWLADAWHRAGAPDNAFYAELGPGRGTLAADALRAMAGAGLHPPVHLVEGSPALRKVQAAAVPGARFHDDLAGLPDDGPLLLLANEFLDALPVQQMVRTADGWRERMVGLDEGGAFRFEAGTRPMDTAIPAGHADAPEGTIIETCPGAAAVIEEVALRLVRQGGVALFVDYGHLRFRTGSTLQAVRAHRKVAVFDTPAEADLTAHVDFATLADVARAAGARVSGMTEQGAFLQALGLEARAAQLSARSPARAGEQAAAVDRLAGAEQMGTLFKVMALAAPGWPDGAGF
ncbi:SAM-dependent methyltransferase [Croceibacterium sp. TMG7-5b_MA50]|uniref:class I SAM-dependent methyltransferase n=1 Tax=Croceibacterium sp. TMG7-5b_MA50 TaxID=3121290 RepID=UPI0032216790